MTKIKMKKKNWSIVSKWQNHQGNTHTRHLCPANNKIFALFLLGSPSSSEMFTKLSSATPSRLMSTSLGSSSSILRSSCVVCGATGGWGFSKSTCFLVGFEVWALHPVQASWARAILISQRLFIWSSWHNEFTLTFVEHLAVVFVISFSSNFFKRVLICWG